jgi:ABC-2 type transport system permease protein
MSALTYAVSDSRTMLRRNLRHMQRYPSVTLTVVGLPIIFLLLFVYVLGGTMGAGLGQAAASGGRTGYANYLTPAIVLMTVTGACQSTAISVAMDMTEGVIARFRTMAISRPSVLIGHVLGSLIQTLVGLVVVVGVALLVGFRPTATPVEWVAATGVVLFVALALVWLSVAFGLVAKSVETASNLPMPLLLLPFLSSGSSLPGPCPPACGGSPTTNRSPPSSRPCAVCSWAPRSVATPPSPSPGAPP